VSETTPVAEPGAVDETGTISWYSADVGFGFITPEGGGIDVVVYPETLKAAGIETLQAGDAVAFTAAPYRRVREAVSIKIL
jgi:CspA family cold shock protein